MKANCKVSEIEISNGATLKNPYIISGKSTKDPINKKFEIVFNLCVLKEVDGEEKEIINASHKIHIDKESKDAIITINGEDISLIQHLLNDGDYIEEHIIDYGRPSYDELEQWFEDSFEDLSFVDQPLKFYAKIWTLKHISFYGVKADVNFEFID